MPGARTRLQLVEYGTPRDLAGEIASVTGQDRAWAQHLLIDAGSRVASLLHFSANPLSLDARGVRATDFAGLIRLGPSLELEVAPKFLGDDSQYARWREDFYYLSTLSRHGRLLATEKLSSSSSTPRDLSTLVARAVVSMYDSQRHRPLRSYRRVNTRDFYLDGEPDPVDLAFPESDGFAQEALVFERNNSWNATIQAAAGELLPEVSDPVAASGLLRVVEELTPQRRPRGFSRRPVPSRHRAWQPLHELSGNVLKGLGLSYLLGQAHAPGYVLSTWRVWEDLLTLGARLAFGRTAVSPQKGFALGKRIRRTPHVASTELPVFPDLVIEADGARPRFLLDAKYKTNAEKGTLRISEADVYEALAFAKAASCDTVVLAYPALPEANGTPIGACSEFERVEVEQVRVLGVQVQSCGISARGGLSDFAAKLAADLPALCL